MIMLFSKWRNEKVDLLYGCLSYEESYLKMRNGIEATKTRYMKIGSEIDESILEGSNEIEDYQRISVVSAPFSHNRLINETTEAVIF